MEFWSFAVLSCWSIGAWDFQFITWKNTNKNKMKSRPTMLLFSNFQFPLPSPSRK